MGLPPSPKKKTRTADRHTNITKERTKSSTYVGGLLLHGPVLRTDPRLHLALHLRLPRTSQGGQGAFLESLALSLGGGWGKPPSGRLTGLPLAGTGLRPCPVGPSAIGTLGRRMWTAVPSSHPTPLDRAPVVGRLVALRTNGAPGGRGLEVGGDVPPLTALVAKSIWPSRLLKGVNLALLSEGPDTILAQASKGRLAEKSCHH